MSTHNDSHVTNYKPEISKKIMLCMVAQKVTTQYFKIKQNHIMLINYSIRGEENHVCLHTLVGVTNYKIAQTVQYCLKSG